MHKENIFSKKNFMHRAVAKKQILAQEMGQKKNSGRQKIPHPPHHFSNGPSLMWFYFTYNVCCSGDAVNSKRFNHGVNFRCSVARLRSVTQKKTPVGLKLKKRLNVTAATLTNDPCYQFNDIKASLFCEGY